jgi:transposase
MGRCIGLDVHREFAEVAIWEQGVVRSAGRVAATPEPLRLFAGSLCQTDKVDARVLAQLLAAGFLPSVWIADEETNALRRQVARRAQLVRQRTRVKNWVQAILHRAARPPTCSVARAVPGSTSRSCPLVSARRSRRLCASSTSTLRS